jgi:hypothetical protein
MSALLSQILTLMTDVIVPQLQSIHASQAEQRVETDRLNRNIEEFRLEMQMRFASMHAEIAACRQELEDTMVIVRERESIDEDFERGTARKRIIH